LRPRRQRPRLPRCRRVRVVGTTRAHAGLRLNAKRFEQEIRARRWTSCERPWGGSFERAAERSDGHGRRGDADDVQLSRVTKENRPLSRPVQRSGRRDLKPAALRR
jgi:hypothetical protein